MEDPNFTLEWAVAHAAGQVRPIAPPVSVQPWAFLRHWRIMKSDRNTLHFVGEDDNTGSARASSRIRHLDIDCLMGVTHSGRVYSLLSESSHRESLARGDDARWYQHIDGIWADMCAQAGFASFQDVTDELVPSERLEAAYERRETLLGVPILRRRPYGELRMHQSRRDQSRPWAVRLADIPEPYRREFRQALRGSGAPTNRAGDELAWAWDYQNWINGLFPRRDWEG